MSLFDKLRNKLFLGVMTAMLIVSAVPAFAQEDPPAPAINFPTINLQGFFDSFGVYIVVFIGIFGTIYAIPAAMNFAEWVLGKVANSLGGKRG